MLRTMNKYGVPVPKAMAEGIANGTVVATPDGTDLDYLCPVDIDGQTLMLDFDTGSSDLWLFSTEQPSSQTSGHTVFDKTKAKNFQEHDGYSWNISYGDGSSSSGDV